MAANNRGAKCPLNAGGFRLLARETNINNMATFLTRIVEQILNGKAKEADVLKFSSKICKDEGLPTWADTLKTMNNTFVKDGHLPKELLPGKLIKEESKDEKPVKKKKDLHIPNFSAEKMAELQKRLKEKTAETKDEKHFEREKTPEKVFKPKTNTEPKKEKAEAKKDKAEPKKVKVAIQEKHKDAKVMKKDPAKASVTRKSIHDADAKSEHTGGPITCLITRNANMLRTQMKAAGLEAFSNEMERRLLGSKHEVSFFMDGKAKINFADKTFWVPENVLLKTKAVKRSTRPKPKAEVKAKPLPARKPETKSKLEFDDFLGAWDQGASHKSQKSGNDEESKALKSELSELKEKVSILSRELGVEKKQKETYCEELKQLRVQSSILEEMRSEKAPEKEDIDYEKVLRSKVQSFPAGGPRKFDIIHSYDVNGFHKVHLFLWLDKPALPILSFDLVHLTKESARVLACELALRRLQEMTIYNKHFR